MNWGIDQLPCSEGFSCQPLHLSKALVCGCPKGFDPCPEPGHGPMTAPSSSDPALPKALLGGLCLLSLSPASLCLIEALWRLGMKNVGVQAVQGP